MGVYSLHISVGITLICLIAGVTFLRITENRSMRELHRRNIRTLSMFLIFYSWVSTANTAWLALSRVDKLKDLAEEKGYLVEAQKISTPEEIDEWMIETPAGNIVRWRQPSGVRTGTGRFAAGDFSTGHIDPGSGICERSRQF